MHRITPGRSHSDDQILSHPTLPLDRNIRLFVESKWREKNDLQRVADWLRITQLYDKPTRKRTVF